MIRISTERPNSKGPAITPTTAKILQQAYDHFNRELFGRSLPDVVIVLHRKSHSFGYFGADRFTERGGDLHHHELALNPDGFIGRTDLQICSTLGHEMCHVWQKVCGTPSARAYHNKEWAAQMKTIGLQPSSTGQVGGKETGQRMTHYVIRGGRFEKSFTRLAATGWTLNLESTAHAGRQGGGPNTGKTKSAARVIAESTLGANQASTCFARPASPRNSKPAAFLISARSSMGRACAKPRLKRNHCDGWAWTLSQRLAL